MNGHRQGVIPLLGLAILIAGCGGENETKPASTPVAVSDPWFRDVAGDAGIDFTWVSGHQEDFLLPEIIGGGVALLDIDNDGDLDIYFVQGGDVRKAVVQPGTNTVSNRLYRNMGDWTFEDVTEESGAGDPGYGQGVATGDFDNDGDVDLYVTNVGPNALLVNDGTGRFTNTAIEAGVAHPGWGASTAFFDYDADGLLDLYVSNYINWTPMTELDCFSTTGADYCSPKNYDSPAIDVLYRNMGDGTFQNVTDRSNISSASGNGLGIGCVDFNGDGWTDVFVANDGTADQLWRNNGNVTFTDIGLLAGCALDDEGKAKAGMGVTISDIDDDGDFDLLVCNLTGESDSFYRNQGDHFVDATATAGLKSVSKPFTRFGMSWTDFDNDGHLDLFEANGRVLRTPVPEGIDPYAQENILMRGTSTGRFEEVLPRGGVAPARSFTSRGAAFGDLDSDGSIDIVVVNRDAPAAILRNVAPRPGNSITFDVRDSRGRHALGANLVARVGARTLSRPVMTSTSYMAANGPGVHLGLGDVETVDEVSILWPDGTMERYGPFPAGGTQLLRQGQGNP